jgi:hypothetical protein
MVKSKSKGGSKKGRFAKWVKAPKGKATSGPVKKPQRVNPRPRG